MKTSDAAKLVTLASHIDNRDPSREAAEAWAAVFTAAGVDSVQDCVTAIGQHFAESTDYLVPAMIIKRVKAARRQRTAAAGQPNFPPGLTFTQEQHYRRAWFALVGDGAEPDAATAAVDERFQITRPELKPRPVRELVEGAWAL